MRRLCLVFAVTYSLFVAGCGGSSNSNSSSTTSGGGGGGGGGGPATLQSIQIKPATASIAQDTAQAFTATGIYSDGSTQDLTATAQWACLGTTLATVSNTAPTQGLVTGWYPGTAVISASSGSVSNSVQLTVTGASVASLAVTPATATIGYLNQQQFTAIATFSDGTTQDVTNSPPVTPADSTPVGISWSLGVPFIASNSGLVIGEGLGTSETVTATFTQAPNADGQGVSASATATATSTIDLSDLVSVSILPAVPTIANNTEVQFSALGTFNDGSTRDVTSLVTAWSSSNYAVAADYGAEPNVFTAAATGVQLPATATITATIGTFSAITPATLTVSDATLQSIALAPANASLAPTTRLSYTATGTFSDTSTQDLTGLVKWTVQDITGTATVNNQGQLTGSSAGSVTVTATSNSKLGSIPGSATATVTSATLQSIAVTPAPAFIAPGATITFSAIGTFSDSSTQDVSALATWTSASSTVATVAGPKSPAVTGQGVGQSTITAKWTGTSATANLMVALPTLISIAVTPATATVAVGASTQLTATGTFTDGTTQDFTSLVNWSSSNATAATVGYQTGLVSGLASGTSTITATLGPATSTAQVTVQ
jgi:hypothetical protein